MGDPIEHIKGIWREFPRGLVSILGLLATIVGISWGLSDPISGILPANEIQKNSVWIRLMIASALSGIIYCAFDIAYYIYRRGAALRVDEDVNECLLAQIEKPNCSEIRIFASGGDEAKARFIRLTQSTQKTPKQVAIKILLRSDGTQKRMQALEDLAQKWRKDIDEATTKKKSGYRFTTTFATHECPVMLRGYIFGEDVAAISWYARDEGLRSPPRCPRSL